jgi:DNA-binding NarL/FixJ family response regulator
MTHPSVLLVDDHAVLRQSLACVLRSRGLSVVGETGDADRAVSMALQLRPTVVVMDVAMSGTDGIAATRRILAADGRQRVVMLTGHAEPEIVEQAWRAGASGYLTKDTELAEVIVALERAVNGERVVSPRVAAAVERCRREQPVLSRREEELLQLIADGMATSEVAARLIISQKTVKNHLASIYDKLQARDRTQAVLTAMRLGIVRLQ